MTEREFMIALLATVIVTLIVLTTIAAAAAERVDEAQTDSEPDEPPGATPNPPGHQGAGAATERRHRACRDGHRGDLGHALKAR